MQDFETFDRLIVRTKADVLLAELDEKCAWKAEHSRRTGYLVYLAGRAMEMSEEQAANNALGAYAHDAGCASSARMVKLMNKKGLLEPGEQAYVKRHAAIGAESAQELLVASSSHDIAALKLATFTIAMHHTPLTERDYWRYDKPLVAATALTQLADRFDALSDPKRPYRRALSYDAAAEKVAEEFQGVHIFARPAADILAIMRDARPDLPEPVSLAA